MRFYNNPHTHSCGIDLHAKTMYLCILGPEDEVLLHENLRSEPEAFLRAIEPYRGDLVVAAECTFTWYWLADLCQREGIDFVLGHALYMKAIPGQGQERQARCLQDRQALASRNAARGLRLPAQDASDSRSAPKAPPPRPQAR